MFLAHTEQLKNYFKELLFHPCIYLCCVCLHRSVCSCVYVCGHVCHGKSQFSLCTVWVPRREFMLFSAWTWCQCLDWGYSSSFLLNPSLVFFPPGVHCWLFVFNMPGFPPYVHTYISMYSFISCMLDFSTCTGHCVWIITEGGCSGSFL